MKLILQEAPMGCAIACAASLAGLSYKKMRAYFNNAKARESTAGFYNRDIVGALSKIEMVVKACSIKRFGNRKIKIGAIIFIKRSKNYLAGHYLLKTKNGWMNPWINYPNIKPVKAGYQKKLPGKVGWVIQP